MYKLNNLQPAHGARKNGKRKGRGPGSGNGTTAGKGSGGQKSRAGGVMGAWFEGGQMPIYRRLPKRGFTPRNRVENTVLNLEDFERLDAAREITVEYLREVGLVKGPAPRVKVLARGEIAAAYKVRVHGVSGAAREKIEASGGSVELVAWSPRNRGETGADPAGSEEK